MLGSLSAQKGEEVFSNILLETIRKGKRGEASDCHDQ